MGVNVTLDEAKKILVPSSVLEELFGLKERRICACNQGIKKQ